MKRTADRQLTKDDDESDHGEEGPGEGNQPRADPETLKKREIIKVRHKKPAARAASGPAPAFNFGVPQKKEEGEEEKAAAAPAVNPLLAKFMMKPGQWSCASCEVVNEDKVDGQTAVKCRACEADRPGHEGKGGKAAAAAAPAAGGFTFGSSATQGATSDAPKVPQFSFGGASGAATSGGFTFGASSGGSTFASVASSGSGGFNFGTNGGGELAAAKALDSAEAPKPSIKGEKEASGEEDETTVYKGLTKVYRMVDEKWQECGKGELHVNQADIGGKRSARFVMRADKTQRVVLNAPLPAGLKAVLQNDKFVKFASLDYTQDDPKLTQFLLRFPGKTEAAAALESVEKCSSFVGGN